MDQEEKKLILEEVLEQEIALYNFENTMSKIALDSRRESEATQKRFEDAQKRFEDAQKRFEDAQKRFEDAQSALISIQQSRIWRYTSVYRAIGGKTKAALKSSAVGKLSLRILKKVFG
jgi:hypothetical protein